MAEVAVLFRVYTEEGMEEKVRQLIADKLKPKGSQTEEVAFGIKTLKVLFIYEDKSREGSSFIEEQIKKIQGVKEVEVIEESLV